MAHAAESGISTRRGGKSPNAFRTISEVASELDVPQHVLRFWETKFAQVHPLKRGGGRRYYRPEDVDLLRRIRELLYTEGYTIKGVQRLLREGVQRPPRRRGSPRPASRRPAAPARVSKGSTRRCAASYGPCSRNSSKSEKCSAARLSSIATGTRVRAVGE